MKKNFLYTLRLSGILLAICVCVSAALAGVNAITKDRIAAMQQEKTQAAVSQVLEGTAEIMDLSAIADLGIVRGAYASEYGYAVEVAPNGFDGEILMMVGVDMDGKVTGVSIISQTETAGLGAEAAADNAKGNAFRDQFLGLTTGEILLSKDGGTLDALTGATISSRAVTLGVQTAVDFVVNNFLGEVGGK